MAATPPRRKIVLVVEDDDLTRETFTIVLEGEGFTVKSAGDGREALEQLQGGPPPDCIVLDLRMPRMDGRQFRAQQRQDPALADIPVVVVSGVPDVRQEAASLGAAEHLRKPVEPDDLVAALNRHC